jgi:hypothetical protein
MNVSRIVLSVQDIEERVYQPLPRVARLSLETFFHIALLSFIALPIMFLWHEIPTLSSHQTPHVVTEEVVPMLPEIVVMAPRHR